MNPEHRPIPLSALQHFLYCPRQCALIHLEQVWAENRFTAEGRAMHERAHDGPDDSRPGVRVTRGLPLQGESLGLFGQADIVEFHADGSVLPVEYKRGKPKAHRADEVQLRRLIAHHHRNERHIPGVAMIGEARQVSLPKTHEIVISSELLTLIRRI